MSHTKRSSEFQLAVNSFIQKLRADTLSRDERVELIRILDGFTTDIKCIVKAADDEPVFALIGRDPLGSSTVIRWATEASRQNLHQDKINDALACASEMHLYAAARILMPKAGE